ncbi:MAG: EF-P beta-lysylation protein EpmB [Halofilum sp. (in: g-proteobacteria)]
MIPATRKQKNDSAPDTVPEWQRELGRAIRDTGELQSTLGLPEDTAGDAGFPVRVPRGYVARMRPGDPCDPLLAQVLPSAAETRDIPGYGPDPVGDRAAMIRPGVLHKYHGRVLLIATGACGIHCRYCFRREFPYADANPRPDDWQAALEYIAADETIEEVILSGGDPLSLPDSKLSHLVKRLEAIPHIGTLRIHTRLPVVLPERVDDRFHRWLSGTRFATVVVLHANHGNEIDASVDSAVQRLRSTGAMVLNQAVLLRGVNANEDAMVDLSRRLFAAGVLPYYLHMLDPVRGAARFEIGSEEACRLMAAVAARLPGYLVPRLVMEEPGRPGKTPLAHDWSGCRDGVTTPTVDEAGGPATP